MIPTSMGNLVAIPASADSFRDWLLWISGAIVAIGIIYKALWAKWSPFRKSVAWVFRRLIGEPFGLAVRGYVREAIAPEIACLSRKIDDQANALLELTALNSEQHAETAGKIEATAAKIDDLQTELARHILANPGLPESVTGPVPIIPGRHRQGY